MEIGRNESVLIVRAWVEPETSQPRARIFELLPDQSIAESTAYRAGNVMHAVELWLSRLVERND